MHIGFQRSGGRGEYEVVGSHSGYTALDLEGWLFNLRWPDGLVRETGLALEPATSGKPRLRSQRAQRFQIGRMVAAMLMLPDPCRDFTSVSAGLPVAVDKRYVLTRIGLGPDTEFTGLNDLVTMDPTFVDLDNQDQRESIGIASRCRRIEAVYGIADQLPANVREALLQHRDLLASGQPVDLSLTQAVRRLMEALAAGPSAWAPGTDPLPELERLAHVERAEEPDLPPPDQLGEEEPMVSARSACQYRIAKARGASGKAFSRAVRDAYDYRCVFCGGRFGGVPGVLPGVDAAHILAWSKYDLDVVSNGVTLCKLHHWAFDAGLIMPYRVQQVYLVRFTTLTQYYESSSIQLLGEDCFEIPRAWLPTDERVWPSEKYLKKVYADLAVSFASDL